jgi:hypothetical protein
MLRAFIGAVCVVAGLLLLAPGGLELWYFGKSIWAAHDVHLLQEPQADIVAVIAGQPVDGDTILQIMAVLGIIVALAGIRILG